jgi:hypothetical protein
MKIASWLWNENECELHSGGITEASTSVDAMVFFDTTTYTASAIVPEDWTREQVDALLRERCEEYRTVMEGCDEGEDENETF